jgi:methylated-DNA-[protein]-cysteine S-methyltransferase
MATPRSDPPRRLFASPVGPLLAELDAEGALVSLGRARVELSGRPVVHPTFARLDEELQAYFAGEPVRFAVPTAPPGSAFQQRVWAELRGIEWGRMITYSELAERVGSNPRAVGQANGANPVAIVIPCHRVVGKDGSLVGYAGGLDMKRALLRLERCLLF